MARKKAQKKEEEVKFELPFAMIYAGNTYLPGEEEMIPEEVQYILLEKLISMAEEEE